MILNRFPNIESLPFHLIISPLKDVEKELGEIICSSLSKNWEKKEIDFEFSKIENYFDGRSNYMKCATCMIWQPASVDFDLVVFATNMPGGWPSILNYYFSLYRNDIIRAEFCDEKSAYPLFRFEYKKNQNIRTIQVLKEEEKWIFSERGMPMPFEKKLNYTKRKISDRLNNQIIDEYLKANDVDAFKEEFWQSKGNAIEYICRY